MNPPPDPNQIDRLLDGEILPDEAAPLLHRLESDPEALNALAERAHLHAALRSSFRRRSLQTEALQRLGPPEASDSAPRGGKNRALLFLAATLLFAGAILAVWFRFQGFPMTVVAASESQTALFAPGSSLRLRSLHLAEGWLQVRLPTGVLLHLNGPIELSLLSETRARLLRGRLTADVGEAGKGFILETSQTRVVDLGTRFGVDASSSTHTDVIVFQGQVELFSGRAQTPFARLQTGDAVRVGVQRRVSRIMSISGDASEESLWSTQGAPPTDALVSEVCDNLTGDFPSLYNFYRILPGGLREQVRAFADSLHQWHDIPDSLLGADLVQTFAADQFNWWLRVSLSLRRPCELFVFADERNPMPEWLRENFTPTGERITLSTFYPRAPGRVHETLQFSIWKKMVASAGTYTLGEPYADPPEDKKSFRPSLMYGIAVRRPSP